MSKLLLKFTNHITNECIFLALRHGPIKHEVRFISKAEFERKISSSIVNAPYLSLLFEEAT
jgi:hypothetical protein